MKNEDKEREKYKLIQQEIQNGRYKIIAEERKRERAREREREKERESGRE